MDHVRSVIFFIVIGLVAQNSLAQESNTYIDTTRVRKTEKINKSIGEKIVDVPGEILKFPVYTVKLVSGVIISNPPVSYVADVIDFHAKAKPYIPIVGYNTRSGLKFGFGLRKLNNYLRTDFVKGKFSYSVNKYQSYHLATRHEKLFSDNFGLELYFKYKKRTRENFYGVGFNSLKSKEANYTFENTKFVIEIPARLFDRVFINLHSGYQISNIYDGQDPNLVGDLDSILNDSDFGLQAGNLDGSRYLTFGASLEWDNKDNNGQPSKGTHALASYIHYNGINRSDGINFNKYSLDIRHYINIWHKRIIALRVFLQRYGENDSNNSITPVYLLSQLGGKETLRGYNVGRFIDNDAAMFSIEYRYPIYDILDAFIFLDEGRVYKKMTQEKFFSQWKQSIGFGVRAWNNRTVTTTIQISKSDESTLFLFEMGAVW